MRRLVANGTGKLKVYFTKLALKDKVDVDITVARELASYGKGWQFDDAIINAADEALLAALVSAHLWSARALLKRRDSDLEDARFLFCVTHASFFRLLSLKGQAGRCVRAAQALLRAEVINAYARFFEQVPSAVQSGCSADGSAAGGDGTGTSSAGASASGGGADQGTRQTVNPQASELLVVVCEVLDMLLHFAEVLKAASERKDPAAARLAAELRASLARSQVLEHAAAAMPRLAAALPPLPLTEAAELEASAPQAPQLQPGWQEAAASGWQNVTVAAMTFGKFLTVSNLLFPIPLEPSSGAEGEAAADTGGAAALAAAQVRLILSGPAVQFFIPWALFVALVGVAEAERRHAAAAATPAPAKAAHAAPAALDPFGGAGGRPPGAALLPRPLVRPLLQLPLTERACTQQQWQDGFACLVQAAAYLSSATAGLPVQGPQGRLADVVALQLSAPAGGELVGVAAADEQTQEPQQQEKQRRERQRQRQQQQQRRRVCFYDLLQAACDGLPTVLASKFLAKALSFALNEMEELLQRMSPRRAAARLPGLWRVLVLQLARDPKGAMYSTAASLKQLGWVLAPPQAQAPQPVGPGQPCYSLRCALDAGLLPALEEVVRNPEIRAKSPEGGITAELKTVTTVLRVSGVWPALLAHGSVPQMAALVSSLTAAYRQPLRFKPLRPASDDAAGEIPTVAMAVFTRLFAALLEQLFVARDLGDRSEAVQRAPASAAAPTPAAAAPAAPPAEVAAAAAAAAEAPHASGSCFSPGTEPLCFNSNHLNSLDGIPLMPGDLVAAGGTPPAGSAAAAQQALLASFALQQWLPLLLDCSAQLTSMWCVQGVQQAGTIAADARAGNLCMVAVVVRVATLVFMAIAAVGDHTASPEPAPAGDCTERQAWKASLQKACARHVDCLLGMLCEPALHSTDPDPDLEAALLDLLQAELAACPEKAALLDLVLQNAKPQGLHVIGGHDSRFAQARDALRPVAERRGGRRALMAVLDAAAAAEAQARETSAAQHARSRAAEQASKLGEELLADPDWRRRSDWACSWLLPPAVVEARLRAAGVVVLVGAGAFGICGGGGKAGGKAGGSSTAAREVFWLCGNPACSSLDGPTALIGPGGGKTCVRCRAVAYCCGACQLEHWKEGGHGAACASIKAAREAAEAAEARAVEAGSSRTSGVVRVAPGNQLVT